MRFPQGAEWLIILVLILLLFGAKRLPDAARGLGRSLRILKAETKGLHDDDVAETPPAQPAPAAQLPSAPAEQVVPPAAAAPAPPAPAPDPVKPAESDPA